MACSSSSVVRVEWDRRGLAHTERVVTVDLLVVREEEGLHQVAAAEGAAWVCTVNTERLEIKKGLESERLECSERGN